MKTQNNKDSEPNIPNGKNRLSGFLISALIMAGWIVGMYFLFSYFMPESYFKWYLNNGTIISIATSVIALIWTGLEEQKGLLSWHPGYFMVSCFRLVAIFFSAMAANLAGPINGVKNRAKEPVSILEVLWDAGFSILMHLLMAVIVLGWLLVIAPLFYFVVLFTGAPARQSIRDSGVKVFIREGKFKTNIQEQPSSDKAKDGWVDVSFSARPFALTNAINASVLFIAQMLIA
jgi:hypothetical protein